MSARIFLLMIAGLAICILAACNWTVGDCYPREEWVKGEGAGGPVGPPVPVITSVASGDFGAEPPEGGERKIQCNKTEDEEEEEEEARPTPSPEKPADPCQQSGAPQMGCTGTKPIDPRAFKFVTTLAYDGTSVAGGWQEATAKLFFGHNLEGDAACVVIVGMPIRAKAWGMISAETAAIYSADVANRCADYLYEDGGRDLPPGIFCDRHKGCMRERFPKYYEELGARVK
ncbi:MULTISPECIES: hypothetical protein [Sorangium]|uniref:Uncharacterized protein n=1 Tax=Sorangium cellulosum TaxID=56 RepID=A0A4P2QN24_SORCE|nr:MULTISPECIES: hypothetical protein [Sorangium]AUX31258.1 hypothetical protein SOCE836_033870 [Sorangium cellulosum]WCQ90642.1 hypothetical protein NQZ70_03353 [Sorangium sp. Soce836]